MRLLLAPMEGLLDWTLRDILTRTPGIDRCVSEFIRVTNTLLPERTFLRIVPELAQGGCTRSGVPVAAQLLGSDPVCLAENAARLATLGPASVDLNFGCPAKVVNRHGGGAALLDDPALLARIVAAVRRAVPPHVPVTAKMRLGTADDRQAEDCAIAIAESGASELVVHARTKAQGYRPPAYWERIADIRAVVRIPLVANGDIWSVADAERCRQISGCDALMLGRGIVVDPGLALAIRAGGAASLSWPQVLPLVAAYWDLVVVKIEPRARAGRLKQWLNFLRRRYPEAEAAYSGLRRVDDSSLVGRWLLEQIDLIEHTGSIGEEATHVRPARCLLCL